MATCPRCGDELTREDIRKVVRIWRVDADGVVTCCQVQVAECALAFCTSCYFREVVSFNQSQSLQPPPGLLATN